MGRKRNMPSRKKIFEYWVDKLDFIDNDNSCFKCGFTHHEHTAVDRAHINSVFYGGSDDVSNIHLLCSECHTESEPWEGEVYDFWFYNTFTVDKPFQLALTSEHYLNGLSVPKVLQDDLDIIRENFVRNFSLERFNKQLIKYKI